MKSTYRHCLKFFLLALLAFSLTVPQLALGTEASQRLQPIRFPGTPRPKPIAVIQRKTAQQTKLLSAEDVHTIQTLQSSVTPRPFSAISPDQKTVVIQLSHPGEEPSFSFLSLQDGQEVAIDSDRFQEFEPGWFYWRDLSTVVAVASKYDNQDNEQYALIQVDRRHSRVKVEPLQLPGTLESVSPDASRVLVQIGATPLPSKGEKKLPPEDTTDATEIAADNPTELRVLSLLNQQEEVYRFAIPAGSVVYRTAWTTDSAQLAIVRGWQTDKPSEFSWGGTSLLARQSRDVMGMLPPVDNPFCQENALIAINLKTGDRRSIDPVDSAIFSDVAWSPDGQKLLAQVNYPLQLKGRSYPVYSYIERAGYRFYDASLSLIANLNAPELANFEDERIIQGQFVSADEVIFTALTGMDFSLYSYHLSRQQLQQLVHEVGRYEEVAVVPGDRQIVFQYSSFTDPPELYQMNLDNPESTPLTAVNEAVAKLNQTRSDPVSFTLGTGETFNGVLIQPADASFPPQDVPLVVWQEGGPASSMTNWWSADVENPYALLPNFGIAVLVLPIYGRYGFGTDRFDRLYDNRNFGQVDIDAMAEVVQQAIAQGYTSPGKIGITGCSYGGYFTLQSIIRHPKLYAAANPQCSWVDMITDWSGDNAILPPFVYGRLTPYADLAEFQQDSPVYNAAKIQTPLLIFHGSDDRLPVTMLENVYSTVATNGTPARMVKFMKAGHGLVDDKDKSIPEYELYAAQEMIQWFRKYLAGGVRGEG